MSLDLHCKFIAKCGIKKTCKNWSIFDKVMTKLWYIFDLQRTMACSLFLLSSVLLSCGLRTSFTAIFMVCAATNGI